MGFNCEYFKSAMHFAFESIRKGADQERHGEKSQNRRRKGLSKRGEAKRDKQREQCKQGRRDSDSHETNLQPDHQLTTPITMDQAIKCPFSSKRPPD